MMVWDFQQYGSKPALIDDQDREVTYEQLSDYGNQIERVTKKRSLAFILCRTSIGSVIGYSAFINAGIVPVLLNAHMQKDLIDNLIRIYEPAYIWLPSDQIDAFSDVKECISFFDYTLLERAVANVYGLYSELCLLLTTSGSTGSPKLVRQSYTNVIENANSIVEYLELTESERPISTLPMHYTYGLSIINSHFMVGATILLTEKSITQMEFWDFFKAKRATSFGGVPYTYEMFDRLRLYGMDLPSLRYMTQAGGKITVELHKKFAEYAKRTSRKFVVMYGQCEATARMGYLPAEKALDKIGSMGIAIPGGTFHLIDVDGQYIREPDVIGELVYEGRNVTMGYAEQGEDLIKCDERHGILETGDMAKFDSDGYYYIVGRKKRFLKIYGNRVNLDEIDRLIKGHFDNIDCASAGIDDHMTIFITDLSLADDIKTFVVKETGLNHLAFSIKTINAIPKNDSGKTLYKELNRYL